MVLSSLLSVGWKLQPPDRLTRVKTCNRPLLLSCSALNMHRTFVGKAELYEKHSCETGEPDFRMSLPSMQCGLMACRDAPGARVRFSRTSYEDS
jgi:hypothetical protein